MPTIRYREMSIPLPSGWEDATQVVGINKAVGDFRANIVVSSEAVSDDLSAEQFCKRNLPSLRSALSAMVLEEEGPDKFGEWSGYKIVYRFMAGGNLLKQIQWYVKHGKTMYTLTCTDVPEHFAATTRSQAEQMFSDFRLLY